MAYPNDVSRIAEGVANYSGSSKDITAPKAAAKVLIRQTFVLYKIAADSMAADTTAYTAAPQIVMSAPCRVLGARIQPAGTLTAHGTTYATLNIVKGDGAAAAAVVAATLVTDVAGGDWVAGVTKTATVSATAASTRIPAGSVLSFNILKASTGVAVPACVISVDVEFEGVDGYGA